MQTNTVGSISLEEMGDDRVLRYLGILLDELEDASRKRHAVEQEITRRLEARNATEMVAEGVAVRLETKYSYDSSLLTPMLELVPQEELEKSGAYIPEHLKTVPATWNATKLKLFGKRGGDIADLIARARVSERQTVKFTQRRGE